MPQSEDAQNSMVVLVVDRLGAFAVGPYGNTSLDTPAFNQLAARSVLFDQAIASQTDLSLAYEDFWLRQSADAGPSSLIEAFADRDWRTLLVTDDTTVAEHPAVSAFDEIQFIDSPAATEAAGSAADTQMANFFACATGTLSDLPPNTFVWLHCRGLAGAWDAPTEYRDAQGGPDDPAAPEFVEPPRQLVDSDEVDPDLLLGFEQAYAAQVMLLDQMIEMLVDQLDQDSALSNAWFCLTSPRGYPLGQHGVVGSLAAPDCSAVDLHHENVNVPLMICPPSRQQGLATNRCGQLFQPSHLQDFLRCVAVGELAAVQFLESKLNSRPDSYDELAISESGDATAVQTQAWKLIQSGDRQQLFTKPDDRWEVNDVSRRCPQVLQELSARIPNRS